MSDAKHTPPGDTSFRGSLLRAVGGALALVVLMAAVFGAIGMLGREAPDSLADDEPSTAEPEDPTDPEDVEEPDETAPDDDPDQPADSEGEPAEDETPDADPPADDPAEDEADDGEQDGPVEQQFDPADVSVQVLDGYGTDGGAAAAGLAATLRDEGYRVVAENPAVAYDVTTVLWTSGYEDQARQVAADIGAPEVREQPGNLSTGVQVHVVVGADRG